jgi:exosortase/archaeosortase family protein
MPILRRQDFLERSLPPFIFAVTAVVFLPVINWLTARTVASEQLLHAFLVFLLTGALIIYERRIPIRPVFRFSDQAQNALMASYLLLVLAIFTRLNLVVLASLCLSLIALLLYLLGPDRKRLIHSSVGAFAAFTGLAVLLPVLDWPLRTLAGECTTYGMGLLGQEARLGLYQGAAEPMLMLFHEGRPYHVAAECNGFGMISSCLLMASIIILYRPLRLLHRAGLMLAALLLGMVFNTLRIVLIVLIAPHLADGHYMAMHEAVGLATTYGGLALLYFILMPREPAGARLSDTPDQQ